MLPKLCLIICTKYITTITALVNLKFNKILRVVILKKITTNIRVVNIRTTPPISIYYKITFINYIVIYNYFHFSLSPSQFFFISFVKYRIIINKYTPIKRNTSKL